MQGYVKLFSTIITSSIWSEHDKTRIVWITMLALADRYGNVQASIPGLAATARVSLPECEAAIKALSSPDLYSRSKDSEGRRIEAIEGGWHLLNYGKYRKMKRSAERTEYLRIKQREHRERVKQQRAAEQDVNSMSTNQPPSTTVSLSQPIAEAEADADANAEKHVLKNNQKKKGSSSARQVFDHWNGYRGQALTKPGDDGKPKRVAWRGHAASADEPVPSEIDEAIKAALHKHPVESLSAAIDNYAEILLGKDFFWTHVWNLLEFLTRGEERHRQAPRQYYQFLPHNFDANKYLTRAARRRQENPDEGPAVYELAKQQLRKGES